MAIFKIVHITKYNYTWPIKESINEVRVFPYNFENQDVLKYQLNISNDPFVEISNDSFGNQVANFNILEPHTEMIIEANMLVQVHHSMKIPEIDTTTPDDIKDEISKSILLQRLCYPDDIEKQKEIDSILKKINCEGKSIIEIARQCSNYIFKKFVYTQGITDIETTVDEILTLKQGVCQDFAHLLLQLLRSCGIPARYVSGYVCPSRSELRGEGATHAWVEIYTPTQGWLGIDPTNNVWTMENHVKLSVGRSFRDCTPVKGTFKGIAKQTMSVTVTVEYEDGRQFEGVNDVKLQEVSAREQMQIDYMEQLQQLQQQQQQDKRVQLQKQQQQQSQFQKS